MMNKQKNNMELIDQYLKDHLSPEDREDFEDHLKNDPEFRQGFEQHKTLVDGIKLHGRKTLRNKMKGWDDEMIALNDGINNGKKLHSFRWYYAAAAITFLIVSLAIIYSNLDSGYEKVLAAHYQPYIYIPDAQRGEGRASDPNESIFMSYDRGEYKQTITSINEIDEADRTDIMNFLLANSYQAEKEYQNAIQVYEKIIESKSFYLSGAQWYVSLCYLSINQPDKAVPILNELKNSNSSYAPKSKELLMELE